MSDNNKDGIMNNDEIDGIIARYCKNFFPRIEGEENLDNVTLEVKKEISKPFRREKNRTINAKKIISEVKEKIAPYLTIAETDSIKSTIESITETFFNKIIVKNFLELEEITNSDIAKNIIEGLEYWRNKTHEGKKVSYGIIVDTDPKDAPNTLNLFKILREDYMAPVADGLNSFIIIDINGNIIDYKQYDKFYADSMLPYRFSSTAEEAIPNTQKIMILTNLGDILLISDRELKYVKKAKQWIQYIDVAEILADQISLIHKKPIEKNDILIRRIYQTCLDVSFAKTGCIIGIIKVEHEEDVKSLVSEDIKNSSEYREKQNFFFLNKNNKNSKLNFNAIGRYKRKELASIDGSFIINTNGKVLNIGDIISIKGGSSSGGRNAAALEISKYGIGIKVSTDGYIKIFKDDKPLIRIE
ncbi:MAG: hypothetical protein LBV68_01090 [Spirochaetaceae bacterium]|jgi:hypothetical protein|nr:hypothetical protein [Spirochaetaceae bacterium]